MNCGEIWNRCMLMVKSPGVGVDAKRAALGGKCNFPNLSQVRLLPKGKAFNPFANLWPTLCQPKQSNAVIRDVCFSLLSPLGAYVAYVHHQRWDCSDRVLMPSAC